MCEVDVVANVLLGIAAVTEAGLITALIVWWRRSKRKGRATQIH